MYVPLNAAIIVHIYRNNRRKGCPIPKTLTQVYTQLSLTLLVRHIQTTDSHKVATPIDSFSDIPTSYSTDFQCLSRLAFEQFKQEKIIFYSDSVPKPGLVHFGFLDSVPALYCGGGVSLTTFFTSHCKNSWQLTTSHSSPMAQMSSSVTLRIDAGK